MTINRRQFAKLLGAAGAAGTLPTTFAYAQGGAKVVIVGGGPGGATVAHYVKKAAPALDVTLVEASAQYTTCFFSNLYLGGFRTFESLVHTYDGLRSMGIKVVTAMATDVDAAKREVKLSTGASLAYDRLVLSPGIDFIWESVPGYSEEVAKTMPHAYKAGEQTRILRSRLDAMEDGGVVVMVAPPTPYRCPPGPYERMCMIAHHLKTKKPKSKLVVLDPKREIISKGPVFNEAFNGMYKGIIENNLSNDIDSYVVTRIDPKTMEIETKAGKKVKAAVANIIPAMKAGQIAFKAGATEGNWCPVNPGDFSSKKVANVFVLGDASVAGAMPKSGFSANSQAKVVANVIVADLAGKPKFPARYRNTCWSMLGPDNSVKVGANYKPEDLSAFEGFVSKPGEDAQLRKQTFEESLGWYSGIVSDTFAKSA
ncbi:MAG TPA: NAD(P)/FAD-dependent oxidoreductase [Hyphomicrobiaceae bacterium]|nr:NAD(P)/FAD-dependent oxidoreductase [Hyphomicrobiaceae bacterium]